MGTPAFAVESLKALHGSKHEVVAVITSVDKPAGRGRKLNQSEVKQYALEAGLPILQPIKLKDEDFLNEVKALKADLFVVVAFRMLPKVLWSLPKYGTFNLHSSLLPNYRGAAPINWAIVNGETKTGVTTFFINENIDTGEILLQAETDIAKDEDAGSLHDRLMQIGAELVLKTTDALENGSLEPKAQNEFSPRKEAPKIFKDDLKINPMHSTKHIYNLIRGMSPFPGAWATVKVKGEEKTLKLFASEILEDIRPSSAGKIEILNKNQIILHLKDGALSLKALQIEGKRRMNAQDFINGRILEEGTEII
tara:strand:- start:69 stop:995 length:927 start_codon:yes stop_codon:yes gene_type:complete